MTRPSVWIWICVLGAMLFPDAYSRVPLPPSGSGTSDSTNARECVQIRYRPAIRNYSLHLAGDIRREAGLKSGSMSVRTFLSAGRSAYTINGPTIVPEAGWGLFSDTSSPRGTRISGPSSSARQEKHSECSASRNTISFSIPASKFRRSHSYNSGPKPVSISLSKMMFQVQ